MHQAAIQNIRERRLMRGWKQKQLAEKCGVSIQLVCDWEKGRRKPSYEVLYRLCSTFDIPHEEIKGLFEPAASNLE